MSTLPSGPYKGRTVEDVLILDPVYLIQAHESGGYNLTPTELRRALKNIDEVDSCTFEDTYAG